LEPHVTLAIIDRNETPLEDDGLIVQHQADKLRISILAREGGIYLDTDVFALKPFTDLLTNPRSAVMGHEGANRYGL
jgi:hypothetical protein